MATETQKSYLAGLIDGEGCIVITAPRPKKGTTNWYGHYLCVVLANTHIPTLDWVKSLWGGCFIVRNQPKQRVPIGNLRWTSAQATEILMEVKPYLRIKEAQASIALLFSESIKRRGDVLSKEEWNDREELRLAISQLNRSYSNLKKVPYPAEKYQGTCPVCNTTFDRERKTKVYCSAFCYEKAKWQRCKSIAIP